MNTQDINSISSIILENYVEGGRRGKSNLMKSAFSKDATIHGFLNGDLLAGPIQLLFDWVDANPPATNLKAEISNIDVVDSIATGKIELSGWFENKFTDQFTLLRENGNWRIISKVFHQHI